MGVPKKRKEYKRTAKQPNNQTTKQPNNQTTKQLNNFKDILVKLGCEPLGESLHRYSKRKVTLYIIRNHEFFGDKRKSQIATDYFFPEPSTIGER